MSIEQIKKITVVGAGDMGHGIAEVALLAGFPVRLYDVNEEAVERGAERIYASAEKLAEKGKVPAQLVDQIRSDLLVTTTDLQVAASDADLVIEAAPEILELKKSIFSQLDEFAPPHALLATNTSTMSVSQISEATKRADQVLGMHFFNPAVLMKLVEVIRGNHTSDETLETGMELGKKFGKVPVKVRRDTPGFIANRVNQAPTVLIQLMLEAGEVTPMGIDAFMRSLGAPMGPCELLDYVGIDVAVNVGQYFADTLHPDYGPTSHVKQLLADGKLGKKSGQGYFDWSNGRPEIDLSQATKVFNPLTMIFTQINEATKLVEDGVCSVADVDVALINSTGNPLGPISVGRQISKWDLTDQLEYLARKYDSTVFQPTQRLKEGGYKH